MKTHVFIGTTCGPVAIQRITLEESGVQSVVCLNGTVQALPISAAYHDFVRRGTGIVARDFQHDAFRVDVAERIDQGVSWQLPMYVAHAVQANGELGNGQPESGDCVIWATGEVGADGVVRPVERTADKLKQSLAQIQQWRKSGIQVRILVPDTNLAEGVEQVSDLAGVAGVHTLAEALDSFAGDSSGAAKHRLSGKAAAVWQGLHSRKGHHWKWALPLVILAVMVGIYWLSVRDDGSGEVIILDDFGGQVTRPETATVRPEPSAVERDADSVRIARESSRNTMAVFATYGDARCNDPQPELVEAGEILRQAGDNGRFCGLAVGATDGMAPLAVGLPEGRLMNFGPMRDGRRELRARLEEERELELAIVWPAGSRPLRAESLFKQWLTSKVREHQELSPEDIEDWAAEQEQPFRVRFVRIKSK
ncbi:hypothetical protein [Wenzhouxiangella sp. EGI_FJ10305]|uniref:hypothetical protein n=1 Tax=Wenzhouxiangella sp. EGI_FJ10305 TaxID=3243768 RepID=UPI0035D8EB30